jgi:3-oxoacyl-[acyl-carrier-protein] synthase-3
LHADGRQYDLLHVDGGPSSTQTTGHVRMQGREVFRHAVVNLHDVVIEALKANDYTADDLDWVVPHQANQRILDGTAKKLGLGADKVITTVNRHANTSAASVPLALTEARADGRIKAGDLVVLEAMGGGFTWGSALIRL